MVDDPSEYVDVLLSDAGRKRAAERELKERVAEQERKRLLSGEEVTVGPELTIEGVAAELERKRLFGLIEELVRWENTTNEEVLERARSEIWQSWRRACARNADHPRAKELYDRHKLPAFYDPFAGGGGVAAGGVAVGAGEPRQRPEPGGGSDQQGDDRDPAEVCGEGACESRGATGWRGRQAVAGRA